ncbi:hypothetical protein BU23DRAFT_570308 [Bimuria novae-zelandiae CBS 107.79]|uniref:DNA helicase Pif1-like 2B domain-containing protein n=1 Tax=Bimuria novae-zelandiae CBS 107.79 TaxID=1447943 RepID=A0A6A5V1S7_9PLEO|nr:hypothetical protein BU23DRAFT_570308 [Bimuria novae-zelandiae CBS 107.79]
MASYRGVKRLYEAPLSEPTKRPRQNDSSATCPTEDPHHYLEADLVPLDADRAPFETSNSQFNGQTPLASNPHSQGTASPREPPLSSEQAALVDLIVNGRRNVFYTGSAGVGKSRVLKAFRRQLASKGLRVNVVAPTSRAALDVNGTTTWSYAFWTPDSMKKPLEDLHKLAWKKTTKQRLQMTDVLVIDEISMVVNLHLERLSLPPVRPFKNCIDCGKPLAEKARDSAYECNRCGITHNDEDKWAFQSNVWKVRSRIQSKTKKFFHSYKDAGTSRMFDSDKAQEANFRACQPSNGLPTARPQLLCQNKPSIDNAVKLYPRKVDVKEVNDAEFRKLKIKPRLYKCIDNFEQQRHNGAFSAYSNEAADGTLVKLAEHRYEPDLELKKGMLVVLLTNISLSEGLVNGSQGVIVGFENFWDEEDEEKPDEEKINNIELSLDGEYKEYRADRIFDFMMAAPRKQ